MDKQKVLITLSGDLLDDVQNYCDKNALPLATCCVMLIRQRMNGILSAEQKAQSKLEQSGIQTAPKPNPQNNQYPNYNKKKKKK